MKFSGPHSSPEMLPLLHPRLLMIMAYVEMKLQRKGKEAEWKSLIRPKLEDTGIHALRRGADMGVKNLTPEERQELVDDVNSQPLFQYDPVVRPEMKAAILNDGKTYDGQPAADHIHFQVGPWI